MKIDFVRFQESKTHFLQLIFQKNYSIYQYESDRKDSSKKRPQIPVAGSFAQLKKTSIFSSRDSRTHL